MGNKVWIIISLLIVVILILGGLLYVQSTKGSIPQPTPTTTTTTNLTSPTPTKAVSSPTPTPTLTTQQAIQAFLASKYNKPLSDVNVTINKEVPGFASGSVVFGQGGPGEGGMWLAAKLNTGWSVVWDGNGVVDCNQMRQQYNFPDSILVPNFCN